MQSIKMKPALIFTLIILAAIWGSSYLFMKMIIPAAGITSTIAARIIIGAAGLFLIAFFIRKLPDIRRNWLSYVILGALNLAIPSAFIVYSIVHLNASISAILNATTPLFTMAVARFWLNEKLTVNKIAGLVTGIAGLFVLLGWMPLSMNSQTVSAIGGSLMAALSYGFANVYSRKKFSGSNPIQTAGGQLAGASLLIIPFFLLDYTPVEISAALVIPILILGLVCTATGFILYFYLIEKAGPVNTSLVTILVPVFSLLWNSIFLSEQVTPGIITGLALIMSGLYLITSPVQIIKITAGKIRVQQIQHKAIPGITKDLQIRK